MSNERRKSGRARIQIFIQGSPASGVSRDLNLGGLFLVTDDRPEIGAVAEVQFVWDVDAYRCSARVVRHDDDGVALKFEELESGAAAALQEMMREAED